MNSKKGSNYYVSNKRREKGSITLFVLVACIFFTIALGLTYIKLVYKSQGVEEDLSQIQDNYAKEEDLSDQDMNVTIQFKDPSLTNTWLKEITLVGSAHKKEGTTRNIAFYAFAEYDTNVSEIEWIDAGEDEKSNITKEIVIMKNGIYRFYIKNDNEEISYSERLTVGNLDNEKPTVGYIKATEINPDDNVTVLGNYNFGKWTSYNVFIEKFDGTDYESGHKDTKMSILKNSLTVPEWQNIDGPITLTEIGTYTIYVTTEDNLGNVTTSEPYSVLIDKNVPTLTLRYNDENGKEYHGEWTNQNIFGTLEIDTKESGKNVQKFQYSQNGYTWNDIIDLTGFDFVAFLNEMLGTIYKGNDTYYFDINNQAQIIANNSNINNSHSQGYMILDLTNYSWVNILFTISAEISSEENHDFGYVEITESENPIDFNPNNDYWIKMSGEQKVEEYKLLNGGKKYYIHFGYYKDSNTSNGKDSFYIQPFAVPAYIIQFTDYRKEGNSATFVYDLESQAGDLFFRAVYNEETQDYSKRSSSYKFRIDKTKPVVETELLSSGNKVIIGVKVTEDLSGLKQMYISKDSTPPTESSKWIPQTNLEFTLDDLEADTQYYLWVQDEAGNISDVSTFQTQINYVVDNNTYTTTLQQALEVADTESISTIKLLNSYTDKSSVTIDKHVKIDLQKFELKRESEILVSEDIQLEITGDENSKIATSESATNTITNKGTLLVNGDVVIENTSKSETYKPIYNDCDTAIVNINDNVWVRGYYYGIFNNSGTINIEDGKVEATASSSSARGIVNESPTSNINIHDGEILGYYGIYNNDSSSVVEMTGGKVVGINANGIHSIGITNLYGGRVEGKAYGIYSDTSGNITIGREEDTLTNLNPVVYGETYGVRLSDETYEFEFFNGAIISKSKYTNYNGILKPRTGYMPYSYTNAENYYCTSLTEDVDSIEMKADITTGFTNKNVTVMIKYPYDITNTKEYSVNGNDWTTTRDYYMGVNVTENRTIYARTKDNDGNIVEEKQITINNIDTELPSITIETNPKQNTFILAKPNSTMDLNITINAEDLGVSGLRTTQYAWVKDGERINYEDFDQNITLNKTRLGIGTYTLYVRATDNAGNVKEETRTYTINYDNQAPKITIQSNPNQNTFILANPNATTDLSITINVEDLGISGLKEAQYAWVKDGENINYEQLSESITLNKTQLGIGTYTLYVKAVDNVGNQSEETREYVINYDNQAPKITIQSNPNQNTFILANPNATTDLSITINVEDLGISGLKEAQYAWVKDGENINYEQLSESITLNKTQLGIGTYTLYVKAVDNVGNQSEETREYVINYDNQAPEIIINSLPNQNTFIVSNLNDTVDVDVTITVQDIGISGLKEAQYAWVKDGERIVYKDFNDRVSLNQKQLEIGTYILYVKAIDNIGNEKEIRQEYKVELDPNSNSGNAGF